MDPKTTNGFVRAIVALLILASLAGTVEAKAMHGGIRGVVFDQSGAAISWAVVKAQNMASGRAYATVASKVGEYWLRNLPAGPYLVTVSSPGFQVLQVPAGAIQAGATGVLPLQLNRTGAATVVAAIASGAAPRVTEAAAAGESDHSAEEFSTDPLRNPLTSPGEILSCPSI
jgi:hypothetical protein